MLKIEPKPEPSPMPRHIAIIMDGNGRWAAAKNLPRIAGHRRGAEAVRRTVVACRELGIDYLTLYAFSSENWKRPRTEVEDLMGLLRLYLRREVAELNENNVRLTVIGDRSGLAGDILSLIDEAEEKTGDNTGMVLALALNYGSQAEIIGAVKEIAEAYHAGRIKLDDITEEMFPRYLYTHELPEPDLLIRTSGEQRLSNFLLWQSAYTELMFIDVLWPDFDKETLMAAISDYGARERRYGGASG